MSPLLLGIDAGTSAIKVQVIDSSGQTVAEASRATEYVHVADNGIEFRPDQLWRLTLEAIRDVLGAVDDPARIAAIACAGVGESGVLVDAQGRVCCNSLAWYDERPAAQMAALVDRYDPQDLVRRSGMSVSPIAGLCKLMWMRDHHPAALGQARYWLHISDFIAFRLSGAAATDFSLAGRTLLLDLKNQSWDRARLQDLDLPAHLLPPLTDNGATIGAVRDEIADELGLAAGCRVVNGGHDHLIGALACGVFDGDVLLDSIGTAEAIMLPISTPVDDERRASWGVEQGLLRIGGEPLYFLIGGLNTASASIDWFRRELADNADYEQLCAAASQVPAGAGGVLFFPYLRGGSPPHARPGNLGAFLNIGTHVSRPHMFRAVVEGLAFDGRKMADCLIELAGRERVPERVLVTGGSSRNALLMRLKANVFERTLDVVTSPQSVSLGAALLAGLGAGVFANWRDGVRRAGAATRAVAPDTQQAPLYRTLFAQRYLPTANGLHAMAGLQS